MNSTALPLTRVSAGTSDSIRERRSAAEVRPCSIFRSRMLRAFDASVANGELLLLLLANSLQLPPPLLGAAPLSVELMVTWACVLVLRLDIGCLLLQGDRNGRLAKPRRPEVDPRKES
jgi:hypothetical protein